MPTQSAHNKVAAHFRSSKALVPMTTPADQEAMSVYANVMEETKARLASINTVTNVDLPIPIVLVREYCFLQLRMVCELIALGCLLVHGDITQTQLPSFRKVYKADEIVRRLGRLHRNFYPLPKRPHFSPGKVELTDFDGEFLRKEELSFLYGWCGDVLHKGNLRNFL